MAASNQTMKLTKAKTAVAETFRNPETRDRWDWVQQAISFAECDSHREFECRFTETVETAVSPFMEE